MGCWMSRAGYSARTPWVLAACASVVVAVLLLGVKLTGPAAARTHPEPDLRVAAAPVQRSIPAPHSAVADAALTYARAYQDGDCAAIIAATGWMQQRLEWVRAQNGPLTTADARDDLCGRLAASRSQRNGLRREGIEDAEVFVPDARVEVMHVDRGRDDLSETVAQRVWLRVRYPNPETAPRDATGQAIASLVAGLNFSPEGLVVKAGIIGSLELDETSVSCDWNAKEEV